jgi:serine/threonine-protein kinase
MEVVQQTVVAVVVSKGPAPRTVPTLLGLDEAGATAALAAIDLTVVRAADIFSNDVPVGQVADQSLASGTAIDRGSSVTIAISKGPDLVAMPSLANLSHAAVKTALTDAGLVLGAVEGNTAGFLYATKAAGAPVVVGQLLLRGTAIDLSYY